MELTTVDGKVMALESEMRKLPQLKIPVVHYFSDGVYAREIFIPAKTILTGKIHKHRNLNILSFGTMLMMGEHGIVRVTAPHTVVSPPGTKRVAYTLTDCVWTTMLRTDLTDVEQIELEFVAASREEYLDYCKTLAVERG